MSKPCEACEKYAINCYRTCAVFKNWSQEEKNKRYLVDSYRIDSIRKTKKRNKR